MKQVFTLLLAAGTLAQVQAQSSTTDEAKRIIFGDSRENRRSGNGKDIVYGNDRRYDERNSRYPSSSRNSRINRIHREYDAKIQSVRSNRRLSHYEKERMIRRLNEERFRRIQAVGGSYYGYNDRYNEREYTYGKDKHNHPGKHKGWYKRKGNPHRY